MTNEELDHLEQLEARIKALEDAARHACEVMREGVRVLHLLPDSALGVACRELERVLLGEAKAPRITDKPVSKPTSSAITLEIGRLRAALVVETSPLKIGHLSAIIEELSSGFDRTADEWVELSEAERELVLVAYRWKTGESAERPSQYLRRQSRDANSSGA